MIRPLRPPGGARPAIIAAARQPLPGVRHRQGRHRRAQGRAASPARRSASTPSDAAIAALQRAAHPTGHVVVMRGAGVCGGPGMGGGASRVVFAIDGAGLGEQVAMLDRRPPVRPGLQGPGRGRGRARGARSAARWRWCDDGDTITIDLDTRRCRPRSRRRRTRTPRRAHWQRRPSSSTTRLAADLPPQRRPAGEGAVPDSSRPR